MIFASLLKWLYARRASKTQKIANERNRFQNCVKRTTLGLIQKKCKPRMFLFLLESISLLSLGDKFIKNTNRYLHFLPSRSIGVK